MERKGDIRHFIVTLLILSIMGNIGQYSNLKDQAEQYKILEYSYHADTADRGYYEYRLEGLIKEHEVNARILLDSLNRK